jgi:hypothetical protein
MVLDHPVQRHQLEVDVVQDLDARLGLPEEDRARAGEDLDVAVVRRDQGR